mmetsp:Transcript_26715/g.67141  ORF Transcript_26715/g.67141 Transcript_26715/m.67141 type:complete len:396 (+) Transcript_26715:536-1723(+)
MRGGVGPVAVVGALLGGHQRSVVARLARPGVQHRLAPLTHGVRGVHRDGELCCAGGLAQCRSHQSRVRQRCAQPLLLVATHAAPAGQLLFGQRHRTALGHRQEHAAHRLGQTRRRRHTTGSATVAGRNRTLEAVAFNPAVVHVHRWGARLATLQQFADSTPEFRIAFSVGTRSTIVHHPDECGSVVHGALLCRRVGVIPPDEHATDRIGGTLTSELVGALALEGLHKAPHVVVELGAVAVYAGGHPLQDLVRGVAPLDALTELRHSLFADASLAVCLLDGGTPRLLVVVRIHHHLEATLLTEQTPHSRLHLCSTLQRLDHQPLLHQFEVRPAGECTCSRLELVLLLLLRGGRIRTHRRSGRSTTVAGRDGTLPAFAFDSAVIHVHRRSAWFATRQ